MAATSRRKAFWFGTEDRMDWFATPLQGADSTPEGWGVSGTLLNGGGYGFNSWGTHKNYTYEWPESSSPEVAQLMKSYRDGTYGRGLLYFIEPMTYGTNILPALWADPSLAVGGESPSIVPGVEPTAVPTSGWEKNGLPVKSAYFQRTPGYSPVVDIDRTVFVPIPEGYTLYLGAFYSGSGVSIYATPVDLNGSLQSNYALTPLGPLSDEVVSNTFTGVKGVRLWVAGGGPVTITALMGRLLKTTDVVQYGTWLPQVTNLATNPSFETGAGTVEVRRNRSLNPLMVSGGGPTPRPNGAARNAHALTTAPGGNPQGVTTALMSTVKPGIATTPLLSAYDADGLGSVGSPERMVGAWFYVTAAGYEARIGSSAEPLQALSPGVWTWLTGTTNASENAMAHVYKIGGNASESDAAYITGVTAIVGGATPVATIAPGATYPSIATPDPDLTPSWTGAENASASILTGVKAAGMYTSAVQTVDYQHAYGGGRILRALSATDGPKGINFNPPGMSASTQYTILLRARASKTIPVVVRIGGASSSSETLTTEWQDIRTTGTVGAALGNTGLLVSGGGAMLAGEWIDVEYVAVVEGAYGGPWFDGDSEPTTDVRRSSWAGTPNASTAQIEARTRTGSPAKQGRITSGPWIGGQGHSGALFMGTPSYVTNSPIEGGRVGFAASFKEVGSWELGI